jgi:hypothetical protein
MISLPLSRLTVKITSPPRRYFVFKTWRSGNLLVLLDQMVMGIEAGVNEAMKLLSSE